MKDSASDPTADIAREYLEREDKEKQVLALLLEKFLGRKDQILVQKTEMGGTEAYVSSVTLEWFAGRVHFASGLPLFQKKYNPETENIEIDADSIDEIQQRPLDWSRQAPLVQYLAARDNHKFPPVLVVINQPWVDNPKAAEWDSEGCATKSTTDFIPLDKDAKVGLLNISEDDVTIYALDGQHRLMGVQGLMELIKTRKLQRYKKDKGADDSFITVNDLIEKYQVDLAYLQNLPKEKIGIEFICAVAAGETRTQARRRVRSIFVHVNLMAAPLTKGQLTQLNEDDGFAIVARKIAVTHPLLEQRQDRNPRVNWNSATVASNSTVLTTLQALQDMSERYLGQKFPHWKPLEKGLIPMRPEDEELEQGIEEFKNLFDSLASLSSYKILEHEDTPALRRFSFEKDGGEGNMLFRPVAQVALAQALGILVFKKGFSLADIFKKLRKFDQQGGFSGMEYPQSLWYGILYDPNKKRVQVAGRDLAAKLLVYILGGIQEQMERAELRKALADARTVEDKTIGFDGKFVEPKAVGLPPVFIIDTVFNTFYCGYYGGLSIIRAYSVICHFTGICMTQTNQDSNNSVSPEIKAKFSTLVAPFFEEHYRDSCYPGLIFRQGKRKMLQINIPAKDFPALLVAKPAKDDDPELGKQRPEVPGHAEEIKNYIIEQARKGKPWILGTLTANVPVDKITILELGRGICIVVIPRDVKLEITDGQHRKTAIQKLIESDESSLISDNDFPITLVLEDDIDQCRKDFGDMAQTKPLGKALLLSFGEVEGRVGITKKLVKQVKIFYDKTDKIQDSPRIQKKFIYTNNYITRAVSCAFTKNPDSELQDYDVESSSNALANCLNKFFFECSNTRDISEKKVADLTISELRKFKDECILGVSAGLEVLGRLLYFTYDKDSNYFDDVKVSQLAQIDWTRSNPIWQDNLIRIDPNPKNPDKRYKLYTNANAVSGAVKTLKDKLGWMENPSY